MQIYSFHQKQIHFVYTREKSIDVNLKDNLMQQIHGTPMLLIARSLFFKWQNAPKGALEVSFKKNDRPNDNQPITNRRTWGLKGKLHFHLSEG